MASKREVKTFKVTSDGLDSIITESMLNPVDGYIYVVAYSERYSTGDWSERPIRKLIGVYRVGDIMPAGLRSADPFLQRFYEVIQNLEYI